MPIKYIKNTGFGLIEVLITLVVTATGLLGLAGLQLQALRSNQIAYNRTQAIVLAYDMADRMAGSRYFCESLFWASQPKQAAKT